MTNPTMDIWQSSLISGRGAGSTTSLISHYRPGDKIVVHNSVMAKHVHALAGSSIPATDILLIPDLKDVWRLRGHIRVLIDHAAMDYYRSHSYGHRSEWKEMRKIAELDRHKAPAPEKPKEITQVRLDGEWIPISSPLLDDFCDKDGNLVIPAGNNQSLVIEGWRDTIRKAIN